MIEQNGVLGGKDCRQEDLGRDYSEQIWKGGEYSHRLRLTNPTTDLLKDPYFETVPATRLDGTPHKTKTKRRKKALPPGISEHDGQVLTKVKRRAYRLDMCLFSFLGVKFGWGSVIGIIPG